MKIKQLLLVFVISAGLCSAAARAQKIGETGIKTVPVSAAELGAGQPLTELLDVFSRNSRELATRFVRQRLEEAMIEQSSEEALIDHILKISGQSGGFEVLETSRPEKNQIRLLARTRRDGREVWIKAFLSKSTTEKLLAFELELVPSDVEKRIKQWKNLRLIGKNAERLAENDQLSGVLLVAKGDKILLHRNYGQMSLAGRRPNRKNTLFPTASMSKMFTAIAIAQLIERGRLSLDDTLARVLPGYPDRAAAERIKIRHLLAHQSGLGNFFNDEYKRDPARFVRPADYFPLFANKPLFFEPGTKFSYSNAGMVVLGAVVEELGKQRFEDYLRANIFAPAGMKSTFYDPSEAPRNRIANLHTRFETDDPLKMEPRRENADHRIASPAGSTYTTAADMLRFIRALQKGKLVKRETLAAFTGQNAPTPPGGKYVFGFESKLYNGKTGYGHSGGAPGVNTNTITFGDGDYTVVILTNYDPGFAQVFARDIAALLANVPNRAKQ
jgi:D-alanyl-D-alanine carboxypeptidase